MTVGRIDETEAAVVRLEPPGNDQRVALSVLPQEFPFCTAIAGNAAFTDTLNEIIVAGDFPVEVGKGHAYVFFLVRIGTAKALFSVFFCQKLSDLICMGGFASIESSRKSNFRIRCGFLRILLKNIALELRGPNG